MKTATQTALALLSLLLLLFIGLPVVVQAQSTEQDPSSSLEESAQESNAISLPEVLVESRATGVISAGTNVTPSGKLRIWLGIAFWMCLVVGILVIAAVIVAAARRPPRGGTGKKRYKRRPMSTKGKRMLPEKYYRSLKHKR